MEIICNTSPLQYLHQLKLLHILPTLFDKVVVPPAVVVELNEGWHQGVDVPIPKDLAWIEVRVPVGTVVLPLVTDLGPGETGVLALALESSDAVIILDDALARRISKALKIRFTGTLGLLLDAKRRNLIPTVEPLLDQLQALRFRLHPETRLTILRLAGELS